MSSANLRTSLPLARVPDCAPLGLDSGAKVGYTHYMSRKEKPLPEMLTARQAAKRKGVAESAVRKALQKDRLKGQKMGTVWMIRVDDVDNWKVKRGPAAEIKAE